jgi:hypothetical protein
MEADFSASVHASVGQLLELFSSGAATRFRSLEQNSLAHLQSARRSLREGQADYARRLAEMQQQQQATEEAAENRIREARGDAQRYKGLLDDANNRLEAQGRELAGVQEQLATSQTDAEAQRRNYLATIEGVNKDNGVLVNKVRILETKNDEKKDKIAELESSFTNERMRSAYMAGVVEEKKLQEQESIIKVKKITKLREDLNNELENVEVHNLTALEVNSDLYQVVGQVMNIDVTTPQAKRELEARGKALTKEAMSEKFKRVQAKKHRQNKAQKKKRDNRDRGEQGQEQTGETLDENDSNGSMLLQTRAGRQADEPEVIELDLDLDLGEEA